MNQKPVELPGSEPRDEEPVAAPSWRASDLSPDTLRMVEQAARQEGAGASAWVDRALSRSAAEALSGEPLPADQVAALLPAIGALSLRLETLQRALTRGNARAPGWADQIKGSVDVAASGLWKSVRGATEKAPPLEEVATKLREHVRAARDRAALDEVASRWKQHVHTAREKAALDEVAVKWREHVGTVRQKAALDDVAAKWKSHVQQARQTIMETVADARQGLKPIGDGKPGDAENRQDG